MSAQKWLPDLRRNRAHRVSREELDADSLFYREEDAALNSMIDGCPVPRTKEDLGPRTIDTREEVATLLRGIDVPLVQPKEARIRLIREVVAMASEPMTADEIVERVVWFRGWDWCKPETLLRTVWNAGLIEVDNKGISAKGRPCKRYRSAS